MTPSMNAHNEQKATSKALQRIRAIASEAGTEQQHGPQFVAGMRRAANLLEKAIAAKPAVQPAAAQEAVATVESFTNGSYHRNYKLRWHKNVDAGTQLFAAPVTAAPYSLDADPQGIRERVAAAISGALAFGSQGNNAPPAGHWLQPFWDIGRAEAELRTPAAPGIDLEPFRRLVEWNYEAEFSAYENGFRTEEQREVAEVERKRLLALIDASPKGNDVVGG